MEQRYFKPENFLSYLKSTMAVWYWLVVVLSLVTVISVFTVPSNGNPIVIVRYVLGLLFVLFLPGFSLIKGLFPGNQLDGQQKFGLSLGTSIALAPLTALLLNYTPFGMGVESIVIALLIITLSLATGAIFREYRLLVGTK